MDLVDIDKHELVGTRRRGNWELACMGEGVGGHVGEELCRKHRKMSRDVVASMGIFRVTFPACIGDF